MSGTFRALAPAGYGVVSLAGVIHWWGVAVADPHRIVAMEVNARAVLCEFVARGTGQRGSDTGTINCLVHRDQKVSAGGSVWKQVIERDANRPGNGRQVRLRKTSHLPLSYDDGSKVMGIVKAKCLRAVRHQDGRTVRIGKGDVRTRICGRRQLHIAPERGCGQIRVHPLLVLDQCNGVTV
jgi:hypothetical protein